MTRVEELRASDFKKLSNEDKQVLAAYLMTQVEIGDLTKRDKKFLKSTLIENCSACDQLYGVAIFQDIGLCMQCMADKGKVLTPWPFTSVGDIIAKILFWGFGLLIIVSWLTLGEF